MVITAAGGELLGFIHERPQSLGHWGESGSQTKKSTGQAELAHTCCSAFAKQRPFSFRNSQPKHTAIFWNNRTVGLFALFTAET